MQAGAEAGVVAVGRVGQDRRRRQLPAGRLLAQLARELRLGLEDDLVGDLRLPPPRAVVAPLLGQIQPPAQRQRPPLPTACTLTVIWQLPILPSVPEYWRFTPGECLPSLTIPVSSTTQATTPISRRHPLRARRAPAAPDPTASRPETAASTRTAPASPPAETASAAGSSGHLLDQPPHIQERVLPLPPQRQRRPPPPQRNAASRHAPRPPPTPRTNAASILSSLER